MNDEKIDEVVFEALSTSPGQIFHQWLVNNYLLSIKATADPNQALYQNAQQTLIVALNTRYARHLERKERQDDWGQTGKPARTRDRRSKA